MNYTKMLNKLITESGLSQKEICDKCKEQGEDVTTTYLSALKNTDGKMASENISRAIAIACNSKYSEILVVQAYIDKAPTYIIEFFEEIREVQNQSTQLTNFILSSLPDNIKGIADEVNKMHNLKSLAEFICEYKGNLIGEYSYDDLMQFTQGLNMNELLAQKLKEDENWLLIPLGDMSKSQIVTKKEAEYIKSTLAK